jgi:hypothetical protein
MVADIDKRYGKQDQESRYCRKHQDTRPKNQINREKKRQRIQKSSNEEILLERI